MKRFLAYEIAVGFRVSKRVPAAFFLLLMLGLSPVAAAAVQDSDSVALPLLPEKAVDAICLVQGRRYDLSANDTAFIPKGAPHRFLNLSQEEMAMLWVYAGDELDREIVDAKDCYGALAWQPGRTRNRTHKSCRIMQNFENLDGGRFVPSASSRRVTVKNPATGATICAVSDNDPNDPNDIDAEQVRRTWAKEPAAARAKLLRTISSKVRGKNSVLDGGFRVARNRAAQLDETASSLRLLYTNSTKHS